MIVPKYQKQYSLKDDIAIGNIQLLQYFIKNEGVKNQNKERYFRQYRSECGVV